MSDKVRRIGGSLLDELTAKAKTAERKRAHYNLHASLDEDVHRLLMAVEAESVFPVHRHPGKWELLTVLRGEVEVFIYNDDASLAESFILAAGSETAAAELASGVFHNMRALKPSVVLEVKKGPYEAPGEKDILKI